MNADRLAALTSADPTTGSRRRALVATLGGTLATLSLRESVTGKGKNKKKEKKKPTCLPPTTCPPAPTCPTLDTCPATICCTCQNGPPGNCRVLFGTGAVSDHEGFCNDYCQAAGFGNYTTAQQENGGATGRTGACAVGANVCTRILCPSP